MFQRRLIRQMRRTVPRPSSTAVSSFIPYSSAAVTSSDPSTAVVPPPPLVSVPPPPAPVTTTNLALLLVFVVILGGQSRWILIHLAFLLRPLIFPT
ncbi:15080_t:CDS:2 [Funneliformis geosporum]|uniref:15080_t:CDS:1 n=1 Tax=Funneliformis geosporum TaxID=1117311 RepID=A0A9W4STU8_9GLOM|nr:15080_t:CDS:2 [Funneliformis geosporum]